MRKKDRDCYAELMWEARLRLEVLSNFMNGAADATYLQTNIESMCLQLRKLLELLAFSSLVSNRQAYEAVRADIAKDWHAVRILKKLETINPDFYPQPVRGTSGGKWRKLRGGFLTRKQFGRLYDDCGEILHVPNPLRKRKSVMAFYRKIPDYVSRLEALLIEHVAVLATTGEMVWARVPIDRKQPVLVSHLVRESNS
ncbi:MAG: hypothetical protein Q7J36_12750 [Thiobacillus sp.]|nr:hypothetical protein [Thiobacillus sp.]